MFVPFPWRSLYGLYLSLHPSSTYNMSVSLHSHPIFARKWNLEPEMEMGNLKKSLQKCINKYINYQNIHMVPNDFGIGE